MNKRDVICNKADETYGKLCRLYGIYFNSIRTRKGISLRQLSKSTGISIALISMFEQGDKLPRLETLLRLVIALGIPYSEVLGQVALEVGVNIEGKEQDSTGMLSNILCDMGLDKNDIKSIFEYIEFRKYKNKISLHA